MSNLHAANAAPAPRCAHHCPFQRNRCHRPNDSDDDDDGGDDGDDDAVPKPAPTPSAACCVAALRRVADPGCACDDADPAAAASNDACSRVATVSHSNDPSRLREKER